jgi:Holliday junction resolvase
VSHYAAGAAFERKVRDKLYEDGAKLVVRSAGSKGPVDLVALYEPAGPDFPAVVELVQVKRGRGMTKAKRQALIELANSLGTGAMVAYPEKVGRKIEVRLEVL